MTVDLSGKVALVTGGARGIGYAIAERFYEAGAHVAVTDLNGAPEAAERLTGGAAAKAFGVDINLKGAFLGTKTAGKLMMQQRVGLIVNISSDVGLTGNAGQANYAASKAGVIGFTKSMARELAPRNVLVNAIAPGFIDTELTKVLPEKVREELLKQIPMGRLGSPDDVAKPALFLASDLADYITGQVVVVDGGMVM